MKLVIGLDRAAPIPMHTDIESGNFEGFEVDLMEEISERLGLTLTYKVVIWSEMLAKLSGGELDAICTAVTVTEDRKKQVDFSKPYLTYKLACVVCKKSGIKNISHLSGKDIGVRKATTAAEICRGLFPENELFFSESNDELYGLLSDGKLDMVIDDAPIAGGHVLLNKDLRIAFLLPGTESQYAIAFDKGDDELKNAVDEILDELAENGFLTKLEKKWMVS